MSTYGVPSMHGPPLTTYPGWSMQLVDKNTFESWKIGQQLTYTLLIDANVVNASGQHHKDIPTFLDLMNNLGQYIMNDDSLAPQDTQKIFDIVVKENKSNYMQKIINNKLLPNSNYDGNIAIKSLKQAIRLNSLDIVKFMINENVTLLSNDMNSFDDIKSLIFNVLRSVEIRSQSYTIATMFWNYLSKCFYELYKNDNNKWNTTQDMIAMNENKLMTVRYSKLFIKNPLIQYAIFKKVYASSIGKHYINKLLPILYFICEHFVVFNDETNLNDLHVECMSDKVFNCDSLIQFNIRNVELFWSEYLTMKLIKDYCGINVLNKYRNYKMNENERYKILDAIQYLIANGVGKNLDNIIMPLLKTDEFMHNKHIGNVFNAIKYGKNIWNVKILQKNEMLSLFENCCIQIPYSLCCEILSFVAL